MTKLKKFEEYTQLTYEETVKELKGCKDEPRFIRAALQYWDKTGVVTSELETIKDYLNSIDLDDFIVQVEKDYFPILDDINNEIGDSIDAVSVFRDQLDDILEEMIEYAGYEEWRVKQLFMNCVRHGIICD